MLGDLSGFFQGRHFDSLDELTPEERENGIFDALMDIEVMVVEPQLYKWYSRAKQTTDITDRMRADLSYWERIRTLRREGKMTSIEDLRAKAQSLSDITDPKELWNKFVEYQKQLAT
jgi:hypothetical protein